MEKERDLLDILLDEENSEPIVIAGDDGEEIMFDQLCVITFEEELYCVLSPITHIEGVGENEVLIFHIDAQEGKKTMLNQVSDDKVLDAVFGIFEQMLEEQLDD